MSNIRNLEEFRRRYISRNPRLDSPVTAKFTKGEVEEIDAVIAWMREQGGQVNGRSSLIRAATLDLVAVWREEVAQQ